MAKIIIVDDMKVVRVFLRKALEKAGHEVEEWDSVTAADVPERIALSIPDAVVTDYVMPGCNGGTLARLAKRVSENLPILVITSTRDEDVIKTLIKQGVSEILFKPLTPEQLVEAVERHLPKGDG